MPLSVEQGLLAGRISAGIVAVDEAIAALEARLGPGQNPEITVMIAELRDGTSVRAALPLDADDSAAVFGFHLTFLQAKRAALAAALAAIGSE